jgi:cold shock CspA family protein
MTEGKEATGRIVKVNEKGYGFIISPDIKFTRIFFHWTSLVQDTLRFDQLKKGMFCKFTPKTVEGKGVRAIRIKIVSAPEPAKIAEMDEIEKNTPEPVEE